MERTDGELVQLVIQKDQSAFAELNRRYVKLIRAIVAYHLKDIPICQEECINDILFAIWQNMDRFDASKNSLKNWIGAVSKYRAINYKKKFYKELISGELSDDIADGKEIDAQLMKKELEEEIKSLLSELSQTDREIFIRRFVMDEPLSTISDSLGKAPAWIYNRISRGRKKLGKTYALKGDRIYEK